MRTTKDALLFRIASTIHNWGFSPNVVTAAGLALGVASGVMLAFRALPFAFILGFLSVFCDVLDGTLARRFQLETKKGLIFDSVSDRVTEASVVVGALFGGIIEPVGTIAIVGSVTLLLLRTVSYSIGQRTDHVMFGRFERLLFILVGLAVPVVAGSTICFVVAGGFGLASALQIAFSLNRRTHLKQNMPERVL
jgi:phosphatidylglycerophosphate synthase